MKKKIKKQKIVITDQLLDELGEFMNIANKLEEASKKIRVKVETILGMVATYDIEIPEKRVKKLIENTKRSIKWIDKN
jgi:hypothetical protein|tara:strand:+ start:217 stop:450 length:234 start_codon:yes stop_codon:yes gene_type:complete